MIFQGKKTGRSSKKTKHLNLFGYKAAISEDGTTVVIGGVVQYFYSNYNGPGMTYIFKKGTQNWFDSGQKLLPKETVNTRFGESIAINSDGSIVAVGDSWYHSALHVFTNPTNDPSYNPKIDNFETPSDYPFFQMTIGDKVKYLYRDDLNPGASSNELNINESTNRSGEYKWRLLPGKKITLHNIIQITIKDQASGNCHSFLNKGRDIVSYGCKTTYDYYFHMLTGFTKDVLSMGIFTSELTVWYVNERGENESYSFVLTKKYN